MKVELIVDGKKIPMNRFVQEFIAGTVSGMVGTLDDVEASPKKIELTVERD